MKPPAQKNDPSLFRIGLTTCRSAASGDLDSRLPLRLPGARRLQRLVRPPADLMIPRGQHYREGSAGS
jgi:hypothetical protein